MIRLREPEVAQRPQIGVTDRRCVVDALGQIHHADVDLVEARRAVIEGELEHRLAEALQPHRPVGEAAIARPEPTSCRLSLTKPSQLGAKSCRHRIPPYGLFHIVMGWPTFKWFGRKRPISSSIRSCGGPSRTARAGTAAV
jgi:hypothetical protein